MAEQTGMSALDNENQNNHNYWWIVASLLNDTILSDNEINYKIRSLNFKQRQIFHFIHNWAMSYTRVNSGNYPEQSKPFYVFGSDSGKCGKTFLIKTIFHAVSKVFLYRSYHAAKQGFITFTNMYNWSLYQRCINTFRLEAYPGAVSFFHWMIKTKQN